MKLKSGGEIWDVDYVSATHKDGRVWNFFSNYELISDEPSTKQGPIEASSATTVEQLKYTLSIVIDRLDLQADQINDLRKYNNRLTDRLNAIEGLGIPR